MTSANLSDKTVFQLTDTQLERIRVFREAAQSREVKSQFKWRDRWRRVFPWLPALTLEKADKRLSRWCRVVYHPEVVQLKALRALAFHSPELAFHTVAVSTDDMVLLTRRFV